MTSPTQRSLQKLRSEDYTVEIVEHWNQWARIRKDLFGFIDLVALKRDETLAVQTTSWANVSARVKKITDSPMLPKVREANWRIVVHGWRKGKSGRWECKEVDLS